MHTVLYLVKVREVNNMNRITKNISILSVCALLMTGCSSSTSSTEDAEDDNVLTVAMECNYAPYNWSTTTETETSVKISDVDYCDGYDVMISTEIADQLDMELEVVKLDWDNLILALQNDEVDAVVAGMTPTEERDEEVDFTEPYYISTEVILVRADSDLTDITSISELSGRKVMGQMNTIYDEIIDQIDGVIHEAAGETFPACVQALLAGSVEAVTSELPVAIGVCEANPELTYIVFDEDNGFEGAEQDASIAVAVKEGNTELLDKIQAVLDTISDEEREEMMLYAVENQPANE